MLVNLVQFLAAGVNGAESGTATFVLRGTASSAASVLYSDFEGTTQPGTNVISLDANGAAEVYCDAYVDVQLRSSGGTLLRTVTVGNSAPLVEVQSTSFTGTDYDNDPANTAGEPITLKALLDKWITSAGAVDWKVLFNGSATNLQTALAGIAGMFINVKDPQFGATGDGVTNDTTAILAAISAAQSAGGGIVFFPPGTYQVTQLNPSVVDVVLMGAGEEASIIRGTSANTFLLRFSDNTAASSKRITGLGFAASAAYSTFIEIEENQQLTIDNCKFDGTNISAAFISRVDADGESNVSISACAFIDVESTACIRNLSDDGESLFLVSGCRFQLTSSFTGNVILGPDFIISQCKFDGSLITSGTYYHIQLVSSEDSTRHVGTVSGCHFLDGGSDGSAFRLGTMGPECAFNESNNTFVGFSSDDSGENVYSVSFDTTYDDSEDGQVVLGSRSGKQFTIDGTSGTTISLGTGRMVGAADTIVINHTNASDLTVNLGSMPIGMRIKVYVYNDSGGTRTISFDGIVSVASVAVDEAVFAMVESAIVDGALRSFVVSSGKRTT